MNKTNFYIDDKCVFLAGSTGSVGSAIMQYILDNYPLTKIKASYRHREPFLKHERVEYVKADLRVLEECKRAVSGCDCAIMAASHSAGSKMMTTQPWLFTNDNIIMNAQMFEAFFHEKVKRVIYIGTATVYQEFEGFIKEDDIDFNKDPHLAYLGVAWISRFLEKLGLSWSQKTGMEVINVRSSNIFGPYANFDPSSSYFIPAIIRKAVDRMDPFEVWGSPDVTRDVLYSEDFAAAIIALLNNTNIKFDAFNIGSGLKTTVGDVVNWSIKHSGHTPSNVHYDLSKPSTIKFRALDVSKIKKVTGWKPVHSIEEGIMKTIEWWNKNKETWKR
ncbi:MAG: NAD(P)-dependent oxidoreductase [Nitrospirota bacterium]|nr:NAD(P)-dependent oxidoreductase [Nitrospirota bacterium]